MSDEELLETYRASVNKAMDEASARDGFATNMSRESIVAGLRAVFDMSKGEKRAEWEAEQGETLTGEIRGLAFEDGEPHGIYCGLDDCGCPDHDNPPRPAGTYITVRLDGEPPVGLWRVQVRRIPVPDTTNNESERKA